MKTLKNKLVLVTLVMSMLMSYAGEKLNKGNQISVTNSSGKIVYTAEVKKDIDLKNLFDFSVLENGKYTVEINRDFEIEINTIEVKNNEVITFTNASKKVYKPVLRHEESRVMISKIAFDTDTIDVELYFENQLIYTETIKSNQATIDRVYKLDDTKTGKYKTVVKTNDRVFEEHFEL